MHTRRGYILPVILIVLLLASAGFFLFTGKQAESPVVERTATTTEPVRSVPSSGDDEEGVEAEGGDAATSTDSVIASTTLEIDL